MMMKIKINEHGNLVSPATPTPLEVLVALPPFIRVLGLLWVLDAVLFSLADFSSETGNAATYLSIILCFCLVIGSVIGLIECCDVVARNVRKAKAGRITRWKGSQVIAVPEGDQVHVHSLHRVGAFTAPDHTCEVFHADDERDVEAAHDYVAAQRERFALQKLDQATTEARALAKVLNK